MVAGGGDIRPVSPNPVNLNPSALPEPGRASGRSSYGNYTEGSGGHVGPSGPPSAAVLTSGGALAPFSGGDSERNSPSTGGIATLGYPRVRRATDGYDVAPASSGLAANHHQGPKLLSSTSNAASQSAALASAQQQLQMLTAMVSSRRASVAVVSEQQRLVEEGRLAAALRRRASNLMPPADYDPGQRMMAAAAAGPGVGGSMAPGSAAAGMDQMQQLLRWDAQQQQPRQPLVRSTTTSLLGDAAAAVAGGPSNSVHKERSSLGGNVMFSGQNALDRNQQHPTAKRQPNRSSTLCFVEGQWQEGL